MDRPRTTMALRYTALIFTTLVACSGPADPPLADASVVDASQRDGATDDGTHASNDAHAAVDVHAMADTVIGTDATADAPAPSGDWPNASNTGVPAGTTLRPSGSLWIREAGTVLEGVDVRGTLFVMADNVTIRRSRAGSINTGGNRGEGTWTGTLIEDVTVDGGGVEVMGIDGLNFTARRVHITGTKNGVRLFQNSTVEDCYIHDLWGEAGDHRSGIGANSGARLVIRHNSIDCTDSFPGCSGALVLYNQPRQDDVLVERNLFNGGSYCVYAGGSESSAVRFLGNRWGRRWGETCGRFGPLTDWHGGSPGNVWMDNRWDDTGAPLGG